MIPTITVQTLHDLGIHKSDAEEQALIEHFTKTLNERIGLTVLDALDDSHAEQLIDLTNKGNQEEITSWLQQNVPEFQELVQDEYDILLGELAESTDKL